MEDEALERIAAAGRDEEAGGPRAGDEGLLHRVPAGDELLAVGEVASGGSDGGAAGGGAHARGSNPGR